MARTAPTLSRAPGRAVMSPQVEDGSAMSEQLSSTPVRFGLVGYGFGGRYFLPPLIFQHHSLPHS